MHVTHKHYSLVRGRIIQFVALGQTVGAVVLLDYKKNHPLEKDGEGRFQWYRIEDLIPDPPNKL